MLGEMTLQQACFAADAGFIGAVSHQRVCVQAQSVERACGLAAKLAFDLVEAE